MLLGCTSWPSKTVLFKGRAFCKISGSQNGLGCKKPLKVKWSNPSEMSRDSLNCIGLLRAPVSLPSNVSQDHSPRLWTACSCVSLNIILRNQIKKTYSLYLRNQPMQKIVLHKCHLLARLCVASLHLNMKSCRKYDTLYRNHGKWRLQFLEISIYWSGFWSLSIFLSKLSLN